MRSRKTLTLRMELEPPKTIYYWEIEKKYLKPTCNFTLWRIPSYWSQPITYISKATPWDISKPVKSSSSSIRYNFRRSTIELEIWDLTGSQRKENNSPEGHEAY